MKYKVIDSTKIHIIPKETPIRDLLLAIAKISYETAIPRGLGIRQPFQAPSQEVCLEDYIKYNKEEPVMLLMDYIAGRDCRTKVFKTHEGKWFLDSYAFQQRGVNSIEFIQGVIRDPANEFLDKVVREIEKET